MTPPPEDPFDPNTWKQKPPQNNPQNPYQQNPSQQNPYQQNPSQQNPYQQNPYQQNPYQQVPPWQLQGQMPFNMQRDLPNSGGILALGIISIVGSFCYAIPGLGCAIPGLIMGNKAIRDYEMNPAVYTQSSYNNAKAGRVCAIVGLCLSSLIILGLIGAVISDLRF
jgi:hypothetical protein